MYDFLFVYLYASTFFAALYFMWTLIGYSDDEPLLPKTHFTMLPFYPGILCGSLVAVVLAEVYLWYQERKRC